LSFHLTQKPKSSHHFLIFHPEKGSFGPPSLIDDLMHRELKKQSWEEQMHKDEICFPAAYIRIIIPDNLLLGSERISTTEIIWF